VENNIPNIINLEDFVKCEKDDQYGYMCRLVNHMSHFFEKYIL